MKLGVGDEVDEQECWERMGKGPITTKFVRVKKCTAEYPDEMARLCARDFKTKSDDRRSDLIAAMPPLKAKKILFRTAVASRKIWKRW